MADGILSKFESFRKAILPNQTPTRKKLDPPAAQGSTPPKDSLSLSASSKVPRAMTSALTPRLSDIGRAVASHVATPARPGNNVQLYVNGSQAYPEMEKQIQGAKKRIDMEFFTFHDDEGGEKIAKELIAKAKSGVEVNLLVDLVSNIANREVLEKMEKAGVRIKRFANGHDNPILSPSNITDHRKILLVDGQAGMTGGMNIGTRYEKYWHDFMVKEQGPSLADMYDRFQKNWELSGGEALRPLEVNTKPQGVQTTQIAVTSPTEREIADSMLAATRAAKDHIFIGSPYFLDKDLVEELKKAAQRKVDVKVVIPTVGDNAMVNQMNQYVTNDLLAAGVKVYLYDTQNPNFQGHDHVTDNFNHGKVMTVDGVWSSIGTANADTRSMVKNQEINLNVDSKQFAKDIEDRIFKNDILTRAKPAKATEVSAWETPIKEVLSKLSPLF
jgi:cardiolipin synthase